MVPGLKLTASLPFKTAGWEKILSFWGPAISSGANWLLVSGAGNYPRQYHYKRQCNIHGNVISKASPCSFTKVHTKTGYSLGKPSDPGNDHKRYHFVLFLTPFPFNYN